MPVEIDIDPIVKSLEDALMPSFAEFAFAINASNIGVMAETCSNRHAAAVHVFGIRCCPAGAGRDVLDHQAVAFVVQVMALERLCFNARIARQASLGQWADGTVVSSSVYYRFTDRKVKAFKAEALSLLPRFAEEVRRRTSA